MKHIRKLALTFLVSLLYTSLLGQVSLSITATSVTDPTNQKTFQVKFQFGQAVSGFAEGDITLTNCTISTPTTADSIDFYSDVTAGVDGSVILNVAGSICVDKATKTINNASASFNITYDGTSPSAPSISGISAGYYNVNQTFTVSGEAGATIEYSTNNGSSWTAYTGAVTLSAEGTYNVLARQTDQAGNGPTASAVITLTIDKSNPAAPTISGISAGSYNTNQTFTVSGEAGATIEYSTNNGGLWTAYSGAVTLSAEGTYNVLARQTDQAGNGPTASAAITLTIDKSNPAAPTISGISAGYFKTNQTFTVSGEAGATIEYSTNNGGLWTAYSGAVTLSAEGTYNVLARQTDQAGNGPTSSGVITLTIDKTNPAAPTISGISAGTFSSDQTFTVSGEAGATIEYSINNGGAWSTYSGAVTLSAAGTYTVLARQTDMAGNGPVTSGSIVITIDNSAPSVSSINYKTPAGSPTNATTLVYTITFSESVSGVDINDFQLTTTGGASGTIASVSSASGTSIDVTINTVAGNGTIRLDLKNSGTSIIDAGSNPITGGFSSGQVYTVDHTVPTVSSINYKSPISSPTNATTLVYTVTFSENVTGVDINDFQLTTTGSASGTIASVSSASGTSIDVTINTVAGNGTIRLDKKLGTGIADDAGNAIGNTAYTSGQVYTIDNTAPAVVLSDDHADAIVFDADLVKITATFTDASNIDETVPPTISIGTIITNVPMIKTSNKIWYYDWNVPSGNDGLVNVSIIAKDEAGNASAAATGQTSYTIDNTAPNAPIITGPTPNPTNDLKPTWNWSSGGNNGNGTYRYKLNSSDFSSGTTTNTNTSFTPASNLTEGTHTLYVQERDVVGNWSTISSFDIVLDLTTQIPTLTNPVGNIVSNSSIFVNFNLPEAAEAGSVKLVFDCTSDNYADRVITFATPGFETIGNHTSTLYGEKLTHLSDGVTLNPDVASVQAGSGGPKLFDGQTYQVYLEYKDVLGNAVVTSVYNTGFKYQVSPPTLNYVRIFSNNSNPSYVGVGGTVTISFTSTTDLQSVSVIAKVAGNNATVTGAGKVWNATYTMKSTDSDVASPFFTIDFKDLVDNTGVQVVASTDGSSVIFDKTVPTIPTKSFNASIAPLKFVKNGSVINASITASEQVVGVAIKLNGVSFATPNNTSGNTWTASYTITGSETEGPLFITVDCKDLAGNQAVQVVDNSITFDKTVPLLSNVSIISNNSINTAFAKGGDVVTLSFTSNEDIKKPSVLINSVAASVNTVGGSKRSWKATRTIDVSENQAAVVFSIPCADTTGNIGTTVSLTSDGSSVMVDRTPPAVVLSNVTVPAGVYEIGSIIPITIPSDADSYIGQTVTVNGYPASLVYVGGNTYKVFYTVQGSHNYYYSATGLSVDIKLMDKAGNITSISNANFTNGTSITINTNPTYQISATATSRCELSASIPVTFTFTGVPPFTFTYSKNGSVVGLPITLPVSDYSYILPVTDGIYRVESLTDATTHSATIDNNKKVEITEKPIPTITFTNTTLAYNTNDPRVDLKSTVGPSPVGGSFTGDGVVKVGADYFFYPSIVTGDFSEITYEVAVDGCSNSDKFTINISNGGYFFGLSNYYCKDNNTSTSVIIEPRGIVSNTSLETFILSPASSFGNTIDKTHYNINPKQMKAGDYKLTYQYRNDDNGLIQNIERDFAIDSVGVLVDFKTLNTEYCSNNPEVVLVAENLYPAGGTGHFTGPLTGFIATNNTATLNPATVTPLDQNFNISYYYQSANGCKSATVTHVTKVKTLPTVSFTLRDNYNYDEQPIELIGNEPTGEFEGEIIEANKKTLNPKQASSFGVLIPVTYSYLDISTGCSNSNKKFTRIYKASEPINYINGASKVELPGVHCWAETLDLNITCEPNIGSGPISGVFSSIKGAIIQLPSPSNTAVYSIPKAALKDGIDIIKFKYFINSTPYEIVKRIEVDSIGPLTLDIESDICKNDNPSLISGKHRVGIIGQNEYLYNGTPGAFTYDAFNATLNPIKEILGEGPYDVTYTFKTDRGGCTSSITKQIRVNTVPIADFDIIAECPKRNQTVTFKNKTAIDANWFWDLDEGTSYAKDTVFNFKSIGIKSISLKATSSKGCHTTKIKQMNIEYGVAADFKWSGECESNDPIKFTYLNDTASVKSAKWILDDNTTTIITDKKQNYINYLFSSLDEHDIKLVINTEEGCKDSITKKISIQPYIKFNELPKAYFNNFEGTDDKWFARSETFLEPKWERSNPVGDIFSSGSPTNAWFTNIGLANQAEERSYVLSPCFDFTNLEQPMIKLNIWSAPEPGRDGAVLQYSIDGGQTWKTGDSDNNVGESGKGVNWYDPGNISSKPADQNFGWSSLDAVTNWKTARYSLDNLKGQPNVKFRIYYANEGRNIKPFNGFAFDDVWIGERQQKVLTEYFTNSIITSSTAVNSYINTYEVNNTKDVIPIHYHTGTPSGDDLYNAYTPGPSSRGFYYGVGEVPFVFANGKAVSNISNATKRIAFEEKVNELTLYDAKIIFDTLYTRNGEMVAELRSTQVLSGQNLVLYCALVKNSIDVNGTTYYNVLRRFMPNPAGVLLPTGTWEPGTVLTQKVTLNIDNPQEYVNSKLVVFVQNSSTNEIYQVASVATSLLTSDKPLDLSNLVDVYPNPARDYLIVECEQSIDRLVIFDLAGRVVGNYIPGQTRFNIPTQNLQGGVYILKGTTKKGEFIRKFVKQ